MNMLFPWLFFLYIKKNQEIKIILKLYHKKKQQ